jgi:flotillin
MQPYTGYQDPYVEQLPAEPGSFIDNLFANEPLWAVVLIAVAVAVGILVFIGIVRSLMSIARPNEALVFSGKRYQAQDGSFRGYRIVKDGNRAFRIPILERVDKIDMRLIPIDIHVQNAYSKGNIPLQIHAVANVKIDSDEALLPNAIERFMERSQGEIQLVAQQTLEGAVREVLAQMTPEEVNEDRLKFAENLIHSAEDDMNKLGLQLDTLKVQHVADDTGYLDSLGRPKIAAAKRDAENAENEAQREITRAQAESGRIGDVAKANAEKEILQKQNELRRIEAELDGGATAVEREAAQAAKTARAEAERELQTIRAELENRRLQADVVIPADINRQARALLAKGEAAPTAENGAAVVEVLQAMSGAWNAMGTQAREIYVIQHLESIVSTVIQNLDDVKIDEVHILDQGDGMGLASYASTYPLMVAEVMKALAESTGVDVPAILNRGATNGASTQGGL